MIMLHGRLGSNLLYKKNRDKLKALVFSEKIFIYREQRAVWSGLIKVLKGET